MEGQNLPIKQNTDDDLILRDLYMLMAIFLESGPCQQAAQTLISECEKNKLFPDLFDWSGDPQIIEGDVGRGGPDRWTILKERWPNLPRDGLLRLAKRVVEHRVGENGSFPHRLLGHGKFDLFQTASRHQQRQSNGIFAFISQVLPDLALHAGLFENLIPRRFQKLISVTTHFCPAFCSLIDHNSCVFFSGGDDGIVRMFCLRTGMLISTFRGHTTCVCDMSLSPDNRFLLTCSLDSNIIVWDLKEMAMLVGINAESPVLTIEVAPFETTRTDILKLMATCSDGNIRLWTVLVGRRLIRGPIKYHCKTLIRDEVRCTSFSPGGVRFATGATDGILRLCVTPSIEEIQMSPAPTPTLQPYIYILDEHRGYINTLFFSPQNGNSLLTGSWDGLVKLWRFNQNELRWTSAVNFDTKVLSRDGYTVNPSDLDRRRKVIIVTFAGTDDCFVVASVYNAVSGSLKHQFNYHTSEVYIVTTNPVFKDVIMTAGGDGRVALWNVSSGERLFEFRDNCRFLDGSFSPCGNYFSLTDDRGRVSLFGNGLSPRSYALTPESQFIPSDWDGPSAAANPASVSFINEQPIWAELSKQTLTGERIPNDQSAELFHPSLVIDSVLSYQMPSDLLVIEEEKAQLAREVAIIPPGTVAKVPKNSRRRLGELVGSDTEEATAVLRQQTDDADPNAEPSIHAIPPIRDDEDEDFILEPNNEEAENIDEGSNGAEVEAESSGENRRRVSSDGQRRRMRRREHSNNRSMASSSTADWIVPDDLMHDDDQPYIPKASSSPRRRKTHKRAPISEVMTPSSWVSVSSQRSFPFLPQIGDIIVYFPRGHAQFLAKTKETTIGKFQRRKYIPWKRYPHLFDRERMVVARVINLDFRTGPPSTWCVATFAALSNQPEDDLADYLESLGDENHTDAFQVAYFDLDQMPDFIIPFSQYYRAVKPRGHGRLRRRTGGKLFKVNDLVNVRFGNDEVYRGRISRVHVPFDQIWKNPWQCYRVEWIDDDEDSPEDFSPWELERPSDDNSDAEPETDDDDLRQALPETIIEYNISMLLDNLSSINGDARLAEFIDPVDYEQFPDYLETIAYPMCISLITERLVNNFYRRPEAIEWDIRLIHRNALQYNLPESAVVKDAEYAERVLFAALRRSMKVTTSERPAPRKKDPSKERRRRLRRKRSKRKKRSLQKFDDKGKEPMRFPLVDEDEDADFTDTFEQHPSSTPNRRSSRRLRALISSDFEDEQQQQPIVDRNREKTNNRRHSLRLHR